MEHFIGVGINKYKLEKLKDDGIVESLLNMTDLLYESGFVSEMAIAEGNDKDEEILMIKMPGDLTNEQADVIVNKLADKLFDHGHTEFDIYVSGDGGSE